MGNFCGGARLLAKSHILDVHLPNIFIGVGAGVEVPIISMVGRQLAFPEERIAKFVALASVFRVLADLPSGVLAEYVGVRELMAWSIVFHLLGCIMATWMHPTAATLASFSVISGFSIGVFFLSRHIYVAGISSREHRGTIMAFLSGLLRWAHVIGPTVLGLVASRWSEGQYYFSVPLVNTLLALVCVVFDQCARRRRGGERDETMANGTDGHLRDPCALGEACLVGITSSAATTSYQSTGECHALCDAQIHKPHVLAEGTLWVGTSNGTCLKEEEEETFHLSMIWTTIVEHWLTIWRLGLYIILHVALRSNRKLLLTFAAMRMNFTDSQLAFLLSISFAFDAFLFPLGGIIMDVYGRRYAMVPVVLGFGVVYTLLPILQTPIWIYFMSALFGLADALGCGVIMTLVADQAPLKFGGPFFGVMRMIQDMGHVLAAMAVSIIVHHTDLVVCCYVWGALGFVTALWALFGVPVEEE